MVLRAKVILLLFAVAALAVARDTYIFEDSEDAIRIHVPYLLNMTNAYLWEHLDLPDVSDDERWHQHLGLVHNRWVKITPNMSLAAVKAISFFPDNGTFVLDLSSALSYEISTDFMYNFFIIPVVGQATIKGSAADLHIVMKLASPPEGQVCIDRELQYAIETVEVRPIFARPEVTLKPENVFTWIFGIKDFIATIFSYKAEVLTPSVTKATVNATEEYFENFYLHPQFWNYSSFSGVFKWNVLNSFCKLAATRVNSIQAIYNATEQQQQTSADLVPSKSKRPQEEKTEVRQLFVQRRLVEQTMEKLHASIGRNLTDKDLDPTMQDRLDIATFQKFVPDAALRSSTSGVKDSRVILRIEAVGNLTYFMEDKQRKYAMGTYSFEFINQDDSLVWGTVGILYEFVPTWVRDSPRKVGYFNVRLARTKLLSKNVNVDDTLIFADRFKAFLDDLVSTLLLSKLEPGKTFLFDNGGIRIEDTAAAYATTDIMWEPDYSEIIITHQK